MFAFESESCYDGNHEQLSYSDTIRVEFLHAIRSTGLVRELPNLDTYDGDGSFSVAASNLLVDRTARRNHPAYRERSDRLNYLTLTDQERWELGK